MPPKSASKKRKAGGAPASDGAAISPVKLEGSEAGQPAPGGGSSLSSSAAGVYLKPPDGIALFRRDLQWDALEAIFNSVTPRFTPPTYTDDAVPLFPTDRSWSFAELYLDCISNSAKANKNLKDKMSESTSFAVNFAKLCLLINVGRINTTLAFYPEMKTVLRTYHPIPSMQLDEFSKKNLQDAPRMKAQLKGCHLPSDAENPPDSLAEVIRRATVLNWKPPACVVSCIFLLYNEWTRISLKYFPEGFSLPDLFYPGDPSNTIPSQQRSEAFLWLLHRFLETPELVASDFANGEAKLPEDQLVILSRQDCTNENVDTEEELQFAEEMRKVRAEFIEKYKAEESVHAASAPSVGLEDGTPVPDDKKAKAHLLERTSSQSGRGGRAASTTPAKKTRTAATSRDPNGTPTAAIPSAPSLDLPSGSTPIPTASDEQGMTIQVPPPGSVTPGIMTPTAIAPQVPAATSSLAAYSRADLWRHALKKKKGQAANAVAKLVPSTEGIAESEVMYQWNQFYRTVPKKERSQLQFAWQKIKRDMDQNRDPVYESEDEADWTPQELQPRLSGFLFRNHRTNSKDVLRYQGNGPAVDSERLSQYIDAFTHMDEGSQSPRTPDGQHRSSRASDSPTHSDAGGDADMDLDTNFITNTSTTQGA